MNKLQVHQGRVLNYCIQTKSNYQSKRICASCSERARKCVRWYTQHLFNVNACACMVLTTPVWLHATLPTKNAHAPVQKMHMHPYMRVYAMVQELLCHENYCELIQSLAQALFRLSFPACHAVVSTKSVARWCSPKKSVQIHASSWHGRRCGPVLHQHYSIIRVGAGLIRLVYGERPQRSVDKDVEQLQRRDASLRYTCIKHDCCTFCVIWSQADCRAVKNLLQ